MAHAIGVSRNLVVAAYEELFADGYVEGRHGSGTFVVGDLPTLPRSTSAKARGVGTAPRWLRGLEVRLADQPDPTARIEFRLGQPSLEGLPWSVWREVWSGVSNRQPPSDYGLPAGELALREALARYLGRARGIACGPHDIVVTSGSVQACDLLARATLAPGDAVAFEDPGYPTARGVFLAARAEIRPIPVDDDGIRVEALQRGADAPLLVYVTPSHQYPLGARLSFARRLALLEWARETDGLILEDDYDSEFRCDAPPLPALASLDVEGRVAYVGTFSKVLSPALRLGYVVAPAPLRERLTRIKRLTDFHTPWPLQEAMAAFVEGGHLDRHVRRMRRHYADKRAALLEALASVDYLARPIGIEAGLHVCVELAPGLDANEIARVARQRGVGVSTLDHFYLRPTSRQALLLGYGGLSLDDVALGVRTLAAVIVEASQDGRSGMTERPTLSTAVERQTDRVRT